MRNKISFVTAVLMVFLFTACGDANNKVTSKAPVSGVSPLESLLNTMIDEYGGESNLQKLDSYISLWNMELQIRPVKGKATIYVEQPDNLRVDLAYPHKSESRILGGLRGAKSYNNEPAREVQGPPLDAMKLQRMRLYTPRILKSKASALSLGETEGYKLITLKDGGLTAIYYVNSTSHRIDKVVGKLNMRGREMEFVTEYSDYKMVDGVLMHHKENKFAGGMNTAILYLSELKTGVKHKPGVFGF